MSQLIELINNYLVKLFFYLKESSQEMVGVGENFRVFGYHDPRTAEIVGLNRDFAKPHEQYQTLCHEIGHGVRPNDSETMRRYGDSVGDYGFSQLEYELAASIETFLR